MFIQNCDQYSSFEHSTNYLTVFIDGICVAAVACADLVVRLKNDQSSVMYAATLLAQRTAGSFRPNVFRILLYNM